MSEAQPQRSVPKRQIARLIGSSEYPMWVLSDDSQLVFVNEAFESLFPELGPEPLGLNCKPDSLEPTPSRTTLARWLALPTNVSVGTIQCVGDQLPNQDSSKDESLLRWIIPLGDAKDPCTLCVLKPDRGDLQSVLDREFHQRVEVPSLAIWESHSNLDSVWFLQGQSLASQSLRMQLQLAITGEHSLELMGQPGNYLVRIAGLIFKERRLKRSQQGTKTQPFTIDCSLMDKDLLQSTIEWIDDTGRKGDTPDVILHRLEMLPHQLRESLAGICRQRKWNYITTVQTDALDLVCKSSEHWDWLIANSRIQKIEILPLSSRTDEIESLLFAWMRRCQGIQWTPAFLDALLAYSWPGDIDELDQALVHATRTATQGVLEESHLPISLRTYPSHIERPVAPDPIDLDQVLERLERMLIERAISLHPRNNTAAAKSLGISRARLLRRMQQWGLGSQPAASPESDEVIFEELDES
jgi:DNA-binding protein Fis